MNQAEIVNPSLRNFYKCIKGHETPVPQGEFITACKYKDKKTGKACKAPIEKISKTEYYCAWTDCKNKAVNSAPGWCRVSIGFARDDGSGGAMENRHVENVRFCSDEHCAEYLRLKADEVSQWK